VNIKAKYFGFIVVDLRGKNNCLWVVLIKHMRETCAEVCSIYVYASELRKVYLFTSGAESLEPRCLERVTEAYRKGFLSITEGSRAITVDTR